MTELEQTERFEVRFIGRLRTGFGEKFGIPRQSGLAETAAELVFEPPYRDANALRGIEEYSHLWLIWQFSECIREDWSPTVRPPRLGGNTRMGVFANRSPYRPNPIGLSCVRLSRVEWSTPRGPVLHVIGADLMDGTPILDIKPYLPYTDSHPEAAGGFTDRTEFPELEVRIPEALTDGIPEETDKELRRILAQDPRPAYRRDEADRIYGLTYRDLRVRFRVDGTLLTVCGIQLREGEQGGEAQ